MVKKQASSAVSPSPAHHLQPRTIQLVISVLAIVISTSTAGFLWLQTDQATRPRLEASLVYWYVVPGTSANGEQSDIPGAATFIAVLAMTNTGRTGVTVGGIEQVDTNGKTYPMLGTVIVSDSSEPQPVNRPIFSLTGGQSVFVLVPLASREEWSLDADRLVVQTLDRTHTTVTVTLDGEPMKAKDGRSVGETCADASRHNSGTICFAADRMMDKVLANPSFPRLYWLCSAKYSILGALPYPQQAAMCQKWFDEQGWPQR
ncbi:MAG: hypothetical protein LBV06_03290 [Propionibacteriaceae bacterium]|jgi:hypothetical protein|nr:hypothetical protein [Propionibacteriaceae bacterium]